MGSNNNERLPEELRGILLDPRDVDAPGQGLSIFEQPASVRGSFRWMLAVGYAVIAVISTGAAVVAIVG